MANIALLSTAHIHTKSFLENITKATDGRRAYAIWDDVVERGQRYARDFNTTFEPNIKKLLRDQNVDGFLTPAELKADLDAILDSVAIMEAAYASAKSGKWVKVKPLA
jgi:predicted dehydrogenase